MKLLNRLPIWHVQKSQQGSTTISWKKQVTVINRLAKKGQRLCQETDEKKLRAKLAVESSEERVSRNQYGGAVCETASW
jgi:hypothetical protein